MYGVAMCGGWMKAPVVNETTTVPAPRRTRVMYVYVGLNHEASRVDGEPLWSGVLVVPKGCIRCKKNMPLSFELDNRTICPALNVRIEL